MRRTFVKSTCSVAAEIPEITDDLRQRCQWSPVLILPQQLSLIDRGKRRSQHHVQLQIEHDGYLRSEGTAELAIYYGHNWLQFSLVTNFPCSKGKKYWSRSH
ncbi:hypothetical protein TNCT_649341 [Trichonephila clavata]|uniref:Uncharacterized protein n=1 Tax=Trichonephila clavata TaxID=2740835 RepID=A0A8X6KWG1_TRICU|nr:hypothetical protein TNCT_649341 [Trichonephila clavata]